MDYEDVKKLKDDDFKCLCSVTKKAFAAMCEIVREYKEAETRGR